MIGVKRPTLKQWHFALSRDVDTPARELVRRAVQLLDGTLLPVQAPRGRKTTQGRDLWLAVHYELLRVLEPPTPSERALVTVREHWRLRSIETVRRARRVWGRSIARYLKTQPPESYRELLKNAQRQSPWAKQGE